MSGPFFERHRSDDPLLDDSVGGTRGSSGGRGIGSGDMASADGGRPFGGGRGKFIYNMINVDINKGSAVGESQRGVPNRMYLEYSKIFRTKNILKVLEFLTDHLAVVLTGMQIDREVMALRVLAS